MAAKHKAYRNLNRRDGVFFSLSHRGRVIGHHETIVFENVTMKHPTAEQLHRVRTGAREVCCWLLGDLLERAAFDFSSEDVRRLACDPKKVDVFCDAESGERVDSARYVVLCASGAWYVK